MCHSVHAAWTVETFLGSNRDLRGEGIEVLPPPFTQEAWLAKQQESLEHYPGTDLLTRQSDGLTFYTPDQDTYLMIVPTDYTENLVKWQHKALMHAGPAKVIAALKARYHWFTLKADVRKLCKACHECQLLNARKNSAHRLFRAQVHHQPRTAWGMDYYGVATSTNGYCQILGCIDLVTNTTRLFAAKNRTGKTTADLLLHGLFLRDGIPLSIHSDAAGELIRGPVNTICKYLGCKQTNTLAHHPTGNSNVERMWQYVAKCLRQMTDKQYAQYERYTRLMEFTWNTSVSRATGEAPFTAAHGLPARTVIGSVSDESLQTTPGTITTAEVEVLAQAAKAYAQAIEQMRTVDKQQTADAANERGRGRPRKYKTGDKVSFFIPPTHEETVRRGRKAKHLLAYRGPAIVSKVLSPTTYELSYQGRRYSRATAELRPYHGQQLPAAAVGTAGLTHEPDENNEQRTIKVGKYVAFRESDANSCRRYHVGRVVRIENDEFVLQTHATSTKNPRTAKWKAVYLSPSSQYTLQKPRGARGKDSEVYDHVPCNEEGETDGLIIREVRLRPTGVMQSKDVKELLTEGYQHHVFGDTFP